MAPFIPSWQVASRGSDSTSTQSKTLQARHHTVPVHKAGWTVIIVTWVMTALGTILLALWIWAYLVRRNRFDGRSYGGRSLSCIMVHWAVALIESILATFAIHYGLGSHIWTLKSLESLRHLLQYAWTGVMLFPISISIGRIAITFLLWDLMQRGGDWEYVKTGLALVTGANVFIAIATAFLTILHCRPVSAIFDPMGWGSCEFGMPALLAIWLVQASMFIVLDIAQIATGLYITWTRQMKRRKKIYLSSLFSAGLLSMAATIIRMAQWRLHPSSDVTYEVKNVYIWARIEEWSVLAAAAVPQAHQGWLLLQDTVKARFHHRKPSDPVSTDNDPPDVAPAPSRSALLPQHDTPKSIATWSTAQSRPSKSGTSAFDSLNDRAGKTYYARANKQDSWIEEHEMHAYMGASARSAGKAPE